MKSIHRSTAAVTAFGLFAVLTACNQTGDSFAKLDADHNGSGSREEFDSYMKQEVFTRVDANHDGAVTMAEWQAFNPQVSETKFRKTDRNGDGSVSRKEADGAFDREGSLDRLFAKIDTDGNGSLSHSEVSAFRDKIRQQPGTTPVQKLVNISQS